MYKIISVATNPTRVQAILRAFEEIFGEGSRHIEPVAVENGVSEQPFGNQGTRTGTRNRAVNARRPYLQADFWIVIGAGVDGDATFSWVVIDNGIQHGEARSATLPLPTVILGRVRKGEAPSPVMLDYTGIDKTGRKEGAIDVFTAGELTCSSACYQAVILALSLFRNAIYGESL